MTHSNINSKEFLRVYGIFIAILAVFIAVLTGMTKISQKSWENGLRKKVEIVLEEKQPDKWIVGKSVKINSPFSMSAACYEIRNRETGERLMAVIIRISTIYGPIPAVFISDSSKNVNFVGFSGVHGNVRQLLENSTANARINYWLRRIPDIISTGVEK